LENLTKTCLVPAEAEENIKTAAERENNRRIHRPHCKMRILQWGFRYPSDDGRYMLRHEKGFIAYRNCHAVISGSLCEHFENGMC